MIAKKYRLPIQTVLKKGGRSIKGHYFLLKTFPNNLSFNRFGIVISKKVSKKATARNKIKRLIFDAAKDFLFGSLPNSDFLIIVSPRIAGLESSRIKDELKELFGKIKR